MPTAGSLLKFHDVGIIEYYERHFFFAWHFLCLSYFIFTQFMKGENVCGTENSIQALTNRVRA